jgi:hypothetical protein
MASSLRRSNREHGADRRAERLPGAEGYRHDRHVRRARPEGEHLPWVLHGLALGLCSVPIGAIGHGHLDYLDEFVPFQPPQIGIARKLSPPSQQAVQVDPVQSFRCRTTRVRNGCVKCIAYSRKGRLPAEKCPPAVSTVPADVGFRFCPRSPIAVAPSPGDHVVGRPVSSSHPVSTGGPSRDRAGPGWQRLLGRGHQEHRMLRVLLLIVPCHSWVPV